MLPDKSNDALAKFLGAESDDVQLLRLFVFSHPSFSAASRPGRGCPSRCLPPHRRSPRAEPAARCQPRHPPASSGRPAPGELQPPLTTQPAGKAPQASFTTLTNSTSCTFFPTGWFSWVFFFPLHFFFLFHFFWIYFFRAFADSWQLRTICCGHTRRHERLQRRSQRGRRLRSDRRQEKGPPGRANSQRDRISREPTKWFSGKNLSLQKISFCKIIFLQIMQSSPGSWRQGSRLAEERGRDARGYKMIFRQKSFPAKNIFLQNYFPAKSFACKLCKVPRAAGGGAGQGRAGLRVPGVDEAVGWRGGVPLAPTLGMELGWSSGPPSITKFHLPFSRTKLFI